MSEETVKLHRELLAESRNDFDTLPPVPLHDDSAHQATADKLGMICGGLQASADAILDDYEHALKERDQARAVLKRLGISHENIPELLKAFDFIDQANAGAAQSPQK